MLFDLVISFSKKTSLSYKEMMSPQACFVRVHLYEESQKLTLVFLELRHWIFRNFLFIC